MSSVKQQLQQRRMKGSNNMSQQSSAMLPSSHQTNYCIECYNPKKEMLEYDYTYEETSTNKRKKGQPQQFPRIRERGEYYIDSFNDQPWNWTFGTNESVRTFLLHRDDDCSRKMPSDDGSRISHSSCYNFLLRPLNPCSNPINLLTIY